jgi:hypothetical protein
MRASRTRPSSSASCASATCSLSSEYERGGTGNSAQQGMAAPARRLRQLLGALVCAHRFCTRRRTALHHVSARQRLLLVPVASACGGPVSLAAGRFRWGCAVLAINELRARAAEAGATAALGVADCLSVAAVTAVAAAVVAAVAAVATVIARRNWAAGS